MKPAFTRTLSRVLTGGLISLLFLTGFAKAEEAPPAQEAQNIRQGVANIIKDAEITSIQPSDVDGMYEVMMGPQLFYVTGDGRYLFSGKLYDLVDRKDLTSPKVAQAKAQAIEAVGEDKMVVFAPEKTLHTITVFTDIDCGYCRKLHSEIESYNDLGIRVRYMMYPRAGVGSESYDKAVSVFCADDPKAAMTQAKAGEEIPKKACDNPVKQHYELGKSLGVNGTPAIFLESGDMLPGYVPAEKMNKILTQLDLEEAKQANNKTQ
ncbi:MAG: DsbC family protein [Candidatus Thiodiazotropha sp.]